jgi:uncharacterized protein YecE (DUF72 family)
MSMVRKQVLLGTSGWSYKEWIGPFYSKDDKSMLRAYTKVFNTVEIDSTFYRYPSKGMVMGWARYTPDGFVFTAKLPKLITHEKKLGLIGEVERDLEQFVEVMEPLWLAGKLGCILIQLPPKLTYQPEKVDSFFKLLPTHVRFAVEFRDASWMRDDTWSLLEKYRVAYTNVDEPLLAPEIHVTSDIAYFRWHGRGSRPWYDYEYKTEELEPWVEKLQETGRKAERVFGYFNNHYHGYAVENCLQVLRMLGTQSPQQSAAQNRVEGFLKDRGKTREVGLETFAEPTSRNFEELLRYLAAPGRLERARDIANEELSISRQTPNRVEAAIREYHIVIDLDDHVILHDCTDWIKMLSTKKLCKHVTKLLLALDRQIADRILKTLYEQKELWHFQPFVGR